ncbi:unnamed protein product, partial [Rotaria socialis]
IATAQPPGGMSYPVTSKLYVPLIN